MPVFSPGPNNRSGNRVATQFSVDIIPCPGNSREFAVPHKPSDIFIRLPRWQRLMQYPIKHPGPLVPLVGTYRVGNMQ